MQSEAYEVGVFSTVDSVDDEEGMSDAKLFILAPE